MRCTQQGSILSTSWLDLFSERPAEYARFRPTYPAALFSWLAESAPDRRLAVDIATGTRQAAVALAAHFERVLALDLSEAQMASAAPHARVEYRRASAEATGLEPASADAVVVAQALHWFQHAAFCEEARRVVRPGGLLAVWCYALAEITPAIDAVVRELYADHLGSYWEPERRLVEDSYRKLTFPFQELAVPAFTMRLEWTAEHLAGYLGTWSALDRYVRDRGANPVEAILPRLSAAWGDATAREVSWPLAVRAFRL